MAPWRALRLPLASCQVDTPSTVTGIVVARPRRDERHTLLFEHRALPLRAAEREAGRQRTVTEHDAMAGNHAGFGIGVQREADEPRITWAGRPASRPDRRSRPLRAGSAGRCHTPHC